MQAQLKQRLVGGVVIMCVLAIFLPVLLHKPKSVEEQSIPMTMPKPQTVSEITLQLPSQAVQPVHALAPAPADKLAAAEQAVVSPPPARQGPKVNPAPSNHPQASVVEHPINTKILQTALVTPQAWVVQVGSFSQAQHALQLVAQLRKHGFNAYSRSHQHITRVYVGPQIDRNKMNAINKKLEHDIHLKGVVRKYNV